VPCAARGSHRPPSPRPALDVADIVRAHGATSRREHARSLDQRAVLRAIAICRTPVLGGHLDVCDTCGHTRPAYNSCRNRHCPKCQALPAARWIDARLARLLPTPYFHVVFTLPGALRGLGLHNRRRLFALLFAARQVSTALAHARRLLAGAAPPITPRPPSDWRALLQRLTGVDLARCPRCAHGTMLRHPLPSGAPVYAPP